VEKTAKFEENFAVSRPKWRDPVALDTVPGANEILSMEPAPAKVGGQDNREKKYPRSVYSPGIVRPGGDRLFSGAGSSSSYAIVQFLEREFLIEHLKGV